MRFLPAFALLIASPAMAQPEPTMPEPPPIPPPVQGAGRGPMRFMLQRTLDTPVTLDLTVTETVARPPDSLRLSAGVVTLAASASEALAANAARMNAVIAALKAAGIAGRDVQTSGLGLSPQYRYQQGQAPQVTGYQARNRVTLTSRNLADAGRLVDALVKAGANEVQGPDFRLADQAAALDAARAAAVKRGQARAALYAAAAGLTVKRLVSLSETGTAAPEPVVPMVRSMAMAETAPTPVEPGEISLSVNLSMQFELAPPAGGAK